MRPSNLALSTLVLLSATLAIAQETPGAPSSEPVRVVGTYPVGASGLEDEIILYFDKELDTERLQKEIIAVKNAPVEGFFSGPHWLRLKLGEYDEDALVRLWFLGALPGKDGAALAPEPKELGFSRRGMTPVRLVSLEPQDGRCRVGIAFAHKADRTAFDRAFQVVHEGQRIFHEITESEQGRIFVAAFERPAAGQAELRLEADFKDATGLLRLGQPWSAPYPPEDPLRVTHLSWKRFHEHEQMIDLRFSDTVPPGQLTHHLAIVDESGGSVPFRVVGDTPANRHELTVHLETGRHIELTVRIDPALSSVGGRRLAPEYEGKLVRHPPKLRVNYNYWQSFDRSPGREHDYALIMHLTENVDAGAVADFVRCEPEVPGLEVRVDGGSELRLFGAWRSNTLYTIYLTPGLELGDGLFLHEEVEVAVRTHDIPPKLAFDAGAEYYYPKRAGAPLMLDSRNLDHAQVALYRLFPSNLPVAIADIEEGGQALAERWMQHLATKRIDLPQKPDRTAETPLDLAPLHLGHQEGVFLLEAKGFDAEGRERESDLQVVVWTNLGVLAHWQDQQLALYAHDLMSLEPATHTQVTIYSNKNQKLAVGTSGGDGVAVRGPFNPARGQPAVVVAERKNDYTFLPLEARTDDPLAFNPQMPRYDRGAYDAFVYADRDLYRPGETVHLHALVRQDYGNAAPAMPLLLRVLKPNNQALLDETIMLSDLGTAGYDLKTERAFPTGRYTAQLFVPGEKTELGRYAFRVEDFVPNRITVDIEAPEGALRAMRPAPVQVKAEHLFGGPAAHRRATVNVVFQRGGISLPGWEDFHFGNDSDYLPETFSLGESTTNAVGAAEFEFSYEPPGGLTFPLQAILVGRVFELGGRTVAARTERSFFPEGPALGVAVAGNDGGGLDVEAAAVEPSGEPADLAEVTVTLERQAWNYYVRRYYSNHEARWSESFETIEERTVALESGRARVTFPEDLFGWGYFRVRVHAEGAKQFSTQSFYAWDGRYEIVREARPSLIKLTLDKDRYQPGDTAQLRIESPFDGTGIVAVQGEQLLAMIPVAITDGVGQAEIGITHAMFPSVWAEVTAVHAVEIGKERLYPFSSFAMKGIAVDEPRRKLAVSFPELPKEMLPDREAEFTVAVEDMQGAPAAGEVTLAAVDEGIHGVTGYDNPNPYAWLSRPRRPDYRRAHYYDKIAYDFEAPAPGGGLDALMGRRSAPPDSNWIKPLALWSGTLELDAQGRAQASFTVPEFSGQLRLVAVAANEEALGAGASHLYVRRPYLLKTSQPRFLLPGDETQCRAVLYNRGEKEIEAAVRWACSGQITGGEGSRTVTVPAGGEATVLAGFQAGGAIGPGTIVWEASISGEPDPTLGELRAELDIPVRAPAAYQSEHELIVLAPGESRTLKNTRFIDDDNVHAALRAGGMPLLRLGEALRYVVHYPHGCLEQTASRLFPMLLLREHPSVAAAVLSGGGNPDDPPIEDQAGLDIFLEAGIRRLFAMQVRGGGLASWPGGNSAYPYGSIYAFHFLTLARNSREIDVPEAAYEALLSYVRERALDWTNPDPHARYLRAYAVYTLALAGDLGALELIERFDSVPLTRDARYLLAAALAMNTNDDTRVSLYLKERPTTEWKGESEHATLRTELRTKAVELLALTKLPGKQPEALERANELMDALGGSVYLNTQECAFIAAALVSYLHEVQEDVSAVRFSASGPGGKQELSGARIYTAQAKGAGHAFEFVNSGPMPIYVDWTLSGIPQQPQTAPLSEGIEIGRTLYTPSGKTLPWDTPLKQGETYVVGLRFASKATRNDVVAVDLLPAGLEIENPRLEPDAIPDMEKGHALRPAHLDLRDDRLVLAFEHISPGNHHFYYIVRAVTPGTYKHPPLSAECMYDARIRAATVPATVQVE